MNLSNYLKYFVIDEGHWYISKVKQITSGSIQQMAISLKIINDLMGVGVLKGSEPVEQFQKFADSGQTKLFDFRKSIRSDDRILQTFLSIQFLLHDLIDQQHLQSTNPKKHKTFLAIQKDFLDGATFQDLCNTYTRNLLERELAIYYRNFHSWLSKFGFLYEHRHRFNLTEAGTLFIEAVDQEDKSDAVFLNQIRKYQIWNPTIKIKYNSYKVIPYYALLQVISRLENQSLTKEEYVLFVSKLKSHSEKSIGEVIDLIINFREYSKKELDKYINKIKSLDKKEFPERARTNYERILDSFSKEIIAYTFGGIYTISRGRGEYLIRITDPELAQKELKAFEESPGYIEIIKQEDWIIHYGSLGGLSLNQLVEIYLNEGRNEKDILSLIPRKKEEVEKEVFDKLYEKDIENYYVNNIAELGPTYEVVKDPHNGQQFATHIGYIVDFPWFSRHLLR